MVCVALIAISLVGARLLLPDLTTFRPDIESAISQLLEQEVSIGTLNAHWRGWTPVIELADVKLARDEAAGTARFTRAHIELNLFRTLQQGKPVLHTLSVGGASITVVRGPDRRIRIKGLGTQGASKRQENGEALVAFLLNQPFLGLESADIIWHDQFRQRPPLRLRQVQIRVHNQGSRHRAELSFRLPGSKDSQARLVLDLKGTPESGEWAGNFYAQGTHLDLGRWPPAIRIGNIVPTSGIADFELWGKLKEGALLELTGEYGVENLHLDNQGQSLKILHSSAQLSYRGMDGGSGLALDGFRLVTADTAPAASRIELLWTDSNRDQPGILRAQADAISLPVLLHILPPLLPTGTQLPGALISTKAQGELRNVRLETRAQGGYAFAGEINQLQTNASGKIPGIRNLSGTLSGNDNGGAVHLDSQMLNIDLPTLYPAPLDFQSLAGDISWEVSAEGWRINTEDLRLKTTEVDAQLRVSVYKAKGDHSPLLDLQARLQGGNEQTAKRFIPSRLLSPKLNHWLSSAIQAGQVVSADMLYRGRTADFPFRQHQGHFETRAQVREGRLRYLPDWPEIREGEVALLFEDTSLDITSNRAKVFDSKLSAVHVRIPDIWSKQPQLQIKGEAWGAGSDGLRFLGESPLEARFQRLLAELESTGDIHLGLKLDIPLQPGSGEPRVAGTIGLKNHAINTRRLGMRLDALNGQLRFDENGLEAEGLTARYLDSPVTATIASQDGESKATVLHMQGLADPAFLSRLFTQLKLNASTVLNRLEGQTDWQASLTLPIGGGNGNAMDTQLRVASDLRGLAIDLPQPLGKDKTSASASTLDLQLSEAKSLLGFRYGEQLQGLLLLHPGDDGSQLERGSIVINGGEASLPSTEGLNLRGVLKRLVLSEWLNLFANTNNTETTDTPTFLDQLHGISLHADSLEFSGRSFYDQEIELQPTGDGGWRVRVDGPTLAGDILLPPTESKTPLKIHLDRLALAPMEDSTRSSTELDPHTLPAMDFYATELSYGEHYLGTVRLLTEPATEGLKVNNLEILAEHFKVQSSGTWSHLDGLHQSRFHIQATSQDLGLMLDALKFEGTASGGSTLINMNVSWIGSPAEFSLATLDGNLHFKAKRGRLLEVKAGPTGRLFGLLTLQSLPRRLKLDFSDLFRKGFAYDRIKGNFSLEDGNAYTNNLVMESPSARVEVAGRVGLRTEDYDQIVTVTPHISSSLPLAGAVLGPVGVGVGAVIWLTEKMFKKPIINRVARSQYTITGSWYEPVITRIRGSKAKQGDSTPAKPQDTATP